MHDREAFEDSALAELLRRSVGSGDAGMTERLRPRLRAAWAERGRVQRGAGGGWPRRRMLVGGLAAAALATAGLAYAASGLLANILDLGKPTNTQSTSSYFPLSGFHRAPVALRAGGRPEVLWIGTAWPGDAASAAERWPLVKALEQFGSFSGMAVAPQPCVTLTFPGRTPSQRACTVPSFDWSKARYRSRYIGFVDRDLIGPDGRRFDELSGETAQLFDRYVRRKPGDGIQAIAASIQDLLTNPTAPPRVMPLTAIGRYVQTQSGEPLVGDFGEGRQLNTVSAAVTHGLPDTLYLQTLSFAQARRALATGKAPSVAGSEAMPAVTFSSLIPDVNAEANIMTALICRADGGKPGTVCGRRVIRVILRHVT